MGEVHQVLDDALSNDVINDSKVIEPNKSETDHNEEGKILNDDESITPPTTKSSSSSLSSSPTSNCDYNDLIVDDDNNDVDVDVDAILNFNNDDNISSNVNSVHHVRGMIHDDNKKAIFTMYTRLEE